MLYIDMIKDCIKSGTQQTSKVYCCGSSRGYKIGQTAQRYMCQRLQTIRQSERDVELYAYIEFTGSKALREYIESALRLYMQGKGYRLQGNDHFTRKGKAKTFINHYIDIVTNTLNALEIDYKVVHRE